MRRLFPSTTKNRNMNATVHFEAAVEALESACDSFEERMHNYHTNIAEKLLKEYRYQSHKEVKMLIDRTKAHPDYEKRYVRDLAKFDPIDVVIPATEKEIRLALESFDVCEEQIGNEPISSFVNVVKVDSGIEPVLALDCEMVETASDNMALARLSAVNVHGEKVIDVLILPCHHSYIEDCRTHITGIFLHDLKQKGIDIETARKIFATKADSNTVLIGHALEHDIMALQLQHPHVIDTALLYPVLEADTGKINPTLSHGLDYLSMIVLKRDMDRNKRKGIHDSVEDSVNSLDLAKHLVALESLKTTIQPIPQRVRPRKRKRGVNYGICATLSAFSDYSLKQSFEGAKEASSVSGTRLRHFRNRAETMNNSSSASSTITKLSSDRTACSTSSRDEVTGSKNLINKVKAFAQRQHQQTESPKCERSKAIKVSSRFVASANLFLKNEKAKKKMDKLKRHALKFSVARRRK